MAKLKILLALRESPGHLHTSGTVKEVAIQTSDAGASTQKCFYTKVLQQIMAVIAEHARPAPRALRVSEAAFREKSGSDWGTGEEDLP